MREWLLAFVGIACLMVELHQFGLQLDDVVQSYHFDSQLGSFEETGFYCQEWSFDDHFQSPLAPHLS